jgi:hypothetical protein
MRRQLGNTSYIHSAQLISHCLFVLRLDATKENDVATTNDGSNSSFDVCTKQVAVYVKTVRCVLPASGPILIYILCGLMNALVRCRTVIGDVNGAYLVNAHASMA